MKRDKHLPSPEVCDWLLNHEWSAPDTVHVSSGGCTGYTNDCCEASAAIGRDETLDLLLPSFGLQVLREDQAARANGEENQPVDDAEPGTDALKELIDKLLKVVRDTDATIPVSIAALEAAKMLFISQVCDLRQQPEE